MRTLAEIIEGQTPLTLGIAATVARACRSMRDRGVGAVMVVGKDGRLEGIFTGRDAVCRVLADGKLAETTRLADVMTRDPMTARPATSAIEVLRLMRDSGFRHVPVVEEGRILGIVSRGDFCGVEIDRLDEEVGVWEKL
ncbi:MAG TPA: CBS domain-containing protein [Stellaceae bacterium]|nr:CBS domain-containing protein [Stellaceae bacterium]